MICAWHACDDQCVRWSRSRCCACFFCLFLWVASLLNRRALFGFDYVLIQCRMRSRCVHALRERRRSVVRACVRTPARVRNMRNTGLWHRVRAEIRSRLRCKVAAHAIERLTVLEHTPGLRLNGQDGCGPGQVNNSDQTGRVVVPRWLVLMCARACSRNVCARTGWLLVMGAEVKNYYCIRST